MVLICMECGSEVKQYMCPYCEELNQLSDDKTYAYNALANLSIKLAKGQIDKPEYDKQRQKYINRLVVIKQDE